ncbi:hydroxyacylglutathione hydrolase [Pseudochelatococcus lubricantis]|uniref:Hydroxyacylglutathione hydrolase n=1 Tax=Pseudochelatococcus lubricantis TaxID=1538102 RepID=A0ABX0V4C6_9HYPH|nr:hydroxyacylglutathione hydrolase [Pseudochelatococcus lubricantis]NIJ59443.1 hydroxyacylglutathione hydrolase [Pseudochelatococcus lubricantis]
MTAETHVFLARTDNIGVLLHDPQTGATAAIDAPEEAAVVDALARTGWQLTDILVTHKHADHIDGILPLKQRFPAVRVTAPALERDAIPAVDATVGEGDSVPVGSLTAQVIATPGHTRGHVAYWFAQDRALFAGDTLFSLGCGRLFEADAATMWASLEKLRALPDDTRLFCGHEYTLSNARFALAVDPDNPALQVRAAAVEAARREGRLTVPSLLGGEKVQNPFLRADDAAFAARLGLAGQAPAQVFAELRARKDRA